MIPLVRRAWSNWLGDHVSEERYRALPNGLPELKELMNFVAVGQRRLRAVGSGHSHSSVARPRDIYVDLSLVTGAFDDIKWLKDDPPGLNPGEVPIRVRAGTTVKQLNRIELAGHRPPLALSNMGTYDGQTLGGAISTGTHGTGLRHGSLAEFVLSMDILTVTKLSDGTPHMQMRRIEPTDGITDRTAFNRDRAEHGMVLEQDDSVFDAAVVSFGCMGVVFAYTLKVEPAYWLKEDTSLVEWPVLRGRLAETRDLKWVGRVPADAVPDRHYWFMLHLAETQGKKATSSPACLVIRRNETDPLSPPAVNLRDWPPERRQSWFRDFFKSVYPSPEPQDSHDDLGGTLRKRFFEVEAREQPFVGNRDSTASYIAHRRTRDASAPDKDPEPEDEAISTEIAVPADRIAEAMDKVIAAVKASDLFLVAPIGVRFSPPSRFLMSPAYDRATAWIEIAIPKTKSKLGKDRLDEGETIDRLAKPELERIANALIGPVTGRPHLGKHHAVAKEALWKVYPGFRAWTEQYDRFNAFGIFDNGFTDTLGISKR